MREAVTEERTASICEVMLVAIDDVPVNAPAWRVELVKLATLASRLPGRTPTNCSMTPFMAV